MFPVNIERKCIVLLHHEDHDDMDKVCELLGEEEFGQAYTQYGKDLQHFEVSSDFKIIVSLFSRVIVDLAEELGAPCEQVFDLLDEPLEGSHAQYIFTHRIPDNSPPTYRDACKDLECQRVECTPNYYAVKLCDYLMKTSIIKQYIVFIDDWKTSSEYKCIQQTLGNTITMFIGDPKTALVDSNFLPDFIVIEKGAKLSETYAENFS
ncbi:MAG: hypothetical protein BVN35_06160 [Proteobacteria bacterium ST_bin11]|nr:MAG: hypothetical protein BVN35_06160 [Proteobacteria bacterium ST_bin11]